jgi:hypothetical protein
VARCAAAKVEAADRVADVRVAYRALGSAQSRWIQSLRKQIADLDRRIVASN